MLKSISYEFKPKRNSVGMSDEEHPIQDEVHSAYVTHDTYGNGDEEYLSHIHGERCNLHSTFEKAQKRVQKHGYGDHEEPVNESSEAPKTFKFLMEEIGIAIKETTAPGMEAWVAMNEQRFIDQYGVSKGVSILNATAWKILESKEEDQLDEMVMDAINHPKLGRIEWRNDGGAHTISSTNKSGSQNIHALGTHQDIAKKWALVKDKFLKESTEWVELGGVHQLEESVVSLF